MPLRYVAECGDSDPGTPHREAARAAGSLLAEAGVVASETMIAIGSAGCGTLTYSAHARRLGRPAGGPETWPIESLDVAGSHAEAVSRVLA